MMNYLEVIQKRRSIRSYQVNEIKEEDLILLLKEAILAPSAHNRQPWRFFIIKGEEKDWLADTMEEKDLQTKKTAQAIRECSLIITVWNGESGNKLEDLISIGGMIEQFCLSATAHNFGTLWMTYPLVVEEELKERFQISYDLVSVLCLGIPAESPTSRPRKDLEELLLRGLHDENR